MYGSAMDMQNRWGQALITQLTADDPTLLETVLAEASAEIDFALAGRYVMPPSPIPVQLRGVCLLFALVKLYDPGTLPADLVSRLEYERDLLQQLAEGKRTMVGLALRSAGQVGEREAGDVRFNAAIRQTNDQHLQGFGR